MNQDELVENLQLIIDYFQQKLESAETTDEYTEYHIAVVTLEETLKRLMTMSSLGYALRVLNKLTE